MSFMPIDRGEVICWTSLDERHVETGNCLHYDVSKNSVDPKSGYLSIHKVCDDFGTYFVLNYYDCQGQWVTDFVADTLEQTKSQAEFEFTGSRKTWKPHKSI